MEENEFYESRAKCIFRLHLEFRERQFTQSLHTESHRSATTTALVGHDTHLQLCSLSSPNTQECSRADPGPDCMQIEVIDDASTTDNPQAVVADIAPGRVGFFRQTSNVGHIRNFETCLIRARGHLVTCYTVTITCATASMRSSDRHSFPSPRWALRFVVKL